MAVALDDPEGQFQPGSFYDKHELKRLDISPLSEALRVEPAVGQQCRRAPLGQGGGLLPARGCVPPCCRAAGPWAQPSGPVALSWGGVGHKAGPQLLVLETLSAVLCSSCSQFHHKVALQ